MKRWLVVLLAAAGCARIPPTKRATPGSLVDERPLLAFHPTVELTALSHPGEGHPPDAFSQAFLCAQRAHDAYQDWRLEAAADGFVEAAGLLDVFDGPFAEAASQQRVRLLENSARAWKAAGTPAEGAKTLRYARRIGHAPRSEFRSALALLRSEM